jgi:hypothetical protein
MNRYILPLAQALYALRYARPGENTSFGCVTVAGDAPPKLMGYRGPPTKFNCNSMSPQLVYAEGRPALVTLGAPVHAQIMDARDVVEMVLLDTFDVFRGPYNVAAGQVLELPAGEVMVIGPPTDPESGALGEVNVTVEYTDTYPKGQADVRRSRHTTDLGGEPPDDAPAGPDLAKAVS